LEFANKELGLRPAHSVADMGSGTGFLSELFLSNGNTVFGIEPNTEMRQAGEQYLADYPNFHSVAASAEATGLADQSVQFVVAGQAFHWFDRPAARREFSRILSGDRWVLLIWNDRRREEEGFDRDYEQVSRRFGTDLDRVRHSTITATDSKILDEFFQPGSYSTGEFENSRSLDLDGVVARTLSSSYLPLPGQPGCEEMLGELKNVFARHQKDGHIVERYNARVFYGRIE
jgi:hypothetical protein